MASAGALMMLTFFFDLTWRSNSKHCTSNFPATITRLAGMSTVTLSTPGTATAGEDSDVEAPLPLPPAPPATAAFSAAASSSFSFTEETDGGGHRRPAAAHVVSDQ
uniref:Secreted protein n=1 Tax=Oryza rufipogon TaxID=4529 RepID=A0A0E0QZM1_ORYRU